MIKGLEKLGTALGYHVKSEFPVEKPCHGTAAAVDLAWFTEQGQGFPLFIFEVESRASNTMANNALKVFAQKTRQFEKPLFFFQVIGSHAEESSRIDNLEGQYGTYNYRSYVIENDNKWNGLIKDVLQQHRRIRNSIDYEKLYNVLFTEWRETVDIYQALRDAFDLGLSRKLRLKAYVWLARSDIQMVRELKAALPIEAQEKWPSIDMLPTYMGSEWGVPIFCAMMIGWADNKAQARDWNSQFLCWQNSSSYMPMITASLGLSYDYDQFLIGVAAPLVALCCALADQEGEFRQCLCDALMDILSKLRGSWHALHTACWLAHISARFGMDEHFQAAMDSINELGGVQERILYCPPSVISFEMDEDEAFPIESEWRCPCLAEFRERAQATHQPKDPERVALGVLVDDEYLYEWAEDLVGALWKNREHS